MFQPQGYLLGQSERLCGRKRTGCWRRPGQQYHRARLLQWDLSLRKAFDLPFREGMRLQFQADAFNAFNRVNWNSPTVNNVGSASFGQITGSLPGRVLQLGGKFTF
jgi:hypothetical protein